MNKQGQFYITAAIIIVLILSGIASLSTYVAVKSEPKTIRDFDSDLKQESVNVIDYGIYSGGDINTLNKQFVEDIVPYYLKKTDNINVILIYGDKTSLYQTSYEKKDTGSVTIGGAESPQGDPVGVTGEVRKEGESVIATINGKEYPFDLKENQMFYFVIAQEREDEIHIMKWDDRGEDIIIEEPE